MGEKNSPETKKKSLMADEENRKIFVKLLKTSRYALRRWKQRHEGGPPVLAQFMNPHSEVVTEEHKLLIAVVLFGMDVCPVSEPKDNLEVCKWLKYNFDVKVSPQTVWSREAWVSAVRP